MSCLGTIKVLMYERDTEHNTPIFNMTELGGKMQWLGPSLSHVNRNFFKSTASETCKFKVNLVSILTPKPRFQYYSY